MSPIAFTRFLRTLVGAGALTATMLLAACGGAGSSATPNPSLTACTVSASDLKPAGGGTATATKDATATGALTIDGSTALKPLFTEAQASFDTVNGTKTAVNGGGSGTGLKDAESGVAQIGMSDFFTQEKSPGQLTDLVDHRVAAVFFTMIVNNDLKGTVSNLTTDEIKKIYDGTYTNWSQIGGPNEAINVIVRTAGSGTRFTFDKYALGDVKASDQPSTAAVQDSTGQLIAAIGATPGSIGYVATGYVLTAGSDTAVTPLCIDGHKPTLTDVNGGGYKFWAFEHAYTKGAATGTAQAFLAFVSGSDFQSMDLAKNGFVKVSDINATATATHQP